MTDNIDRIMTTSPEKLELFLKTRTGGLLLALVSFSSLLLFPHVSSALTKKEAILLGRKAEKVIIEPFPG
jgi:hypothetical protein